MAWALPHPTPTPSRSTGVHGVSGVISAAELTSPASGGLSRYSHQQGLRPYGWKWNSEVSSPLPYWPLTLVPFPAGRNSRL